MLKGNNFLAEPATALLPLEAGPIRLREANQEQVRLERGPTWSSMLIRTFPLYKLGAFKYELWGAYICLLEPTNKNSNF
ncbi:MAG: hypothetical protein V3R25_10495, partial [Nitrosomonadaceae bacterium]